MIILTPKYQSPHNVHHTTCDGIHGRVDVQVWFKSLIPHALPILGKYIFIFSWMCIRHVRKAFRAKASTTVHVGNVASGATVDWVLISLDWNSNAVWTSCEHTNSVQVSLTDLSYHYIHFLGWWVNCLNIYFYLLYLYPWVRCSKNDIPLYTSKSIPWTWTGGFFHRSFGE